MQNIEVDIKQSYDEITYFSSVFPQTSPLALEVCGTLLGINPPSAKSARVLEIGCSFGGNLIPFSIYHPEARVLGVDLSDEQVRGGNEIIKEINIQNLTLLQKDICEFGDEDAKLVSDDGKFDYIIVHGVYSWVPKQVQEAILDVVSRHLSAHGIAYISYNTYPGWKTKEILRDIMLFASKDKATMGEKVAAAREAINAYEAYLNEKKSDVSAGFPVNALLFWIGKIKEFKDYYLAHEYLECINNPKYFREFTAELDAYGLSYLCDTGMEDIFLPNFGIEGVDKYKNENFKDRIDSEQLLDFFAYRAFRQSLIVRRETYEPVCDKQVGPNDINKLHLISNFIKNESGAWVNQNGIQMPQEYNWLYEVFSRVYPSSIRLEQVIELLPHLKLETYLGFVAILKNSSALVALKPYEALIYEAGKTRVKHSVLRLLKYFVTAKRPVISFANEFSFGFEMLEFDYVVAQAMDGKNSVGEITKMLADTIMVDKIALKDENGKAIKGAENIKKYAKNYIAQAQIRFRNLYLFERI